MSPRARRLPPSQWGLERHAGKLALHGVTMSELARRFGTPLFVLDGGRLAAQARELSALGDEVAVAYSYKTNATWEVLTRLAARGLGAEVVSGHELELALRAGVPPERIVLNGPAKDDATLRRAFAAGLALVNANSVPQLERMNALARELGLRPRVGLRFTVPGGWRGQFGVRAEHAPAAFARARALRHLQVCAVHVHVGTLLREPRAVRRLARAGFALWLQARRAGLEVTELDLGGSLATPTVRMLSPREQRALTEGLVPIEPPRPAETLGLRAWAELLRDTVRELARRHDAPTPRLWLEPGRALVASCELLLCSVVDTHEAREGLHYAVLDGGSNLAHVMRNARHELFTVEAPRTTRPLTYRLVGPTCSPGDVLVAATRLPELERGDVLAFMDAGAYFDAFSTSFSFLKPAVVVVDRGGARLTRRAEATDDVLARDTRQRSFIAPGFSP